MGNQKFIQILENFIRIKNVTSEELLEEIIGKEDIEVSVYAYISAFEGLGTSDSDLDLYVIFKDIETYEKLKLKKGIKIGINGELRNNSIVKELKCDIEYWRLEDIEGITKKASMSEGIGVSKDLLKIILRISFLCKLYEKGTFEKLNEIFENLDIRKCIINNYVLSARSIYEDAVSLAKNNEWISAMGEGRCALLEAVGAYNAIYCCLNLKRKWIAKIFIENKGFGSDEYLDGFYKNYVYVNIDEEKLRRVVDDLLDFIQELLMFIELS